MNTHLNRCTPVSAVRATCQARVGVGLVCRVTTLADQAHTTVSQRRGGFSKWKCNGRKPGGSKFHSLQGSREGECAVTWARLHLLRAESFHRLGMDCISGSLRREASRQRENTMYDRPVTLSGTHAHGQCQLAPAEVWLLCLSHCNCFFL